MFGSIGGAELVLVLVLALLLFGPRKLPQIGRTLGRALAEFRGATHEFRRTLEREVAAEDLKQAGRDLRSAEKELASVARTPEGEKETSEERGGPTG